MRQDYIHGPGPQNPKPDGPELAQQEWMRYIVFACIVDVSMILFATTRLSQVMTDDLPWLREIMPPVADLFFLGLLVIFSLKSLTIWRKSETHPKRRTMRSLVLVLLFNVWLFFLFGSYIEPLARWLLVDYV